MAGTGSAHHDLASALTAWSVGPFGVAVALAVVAAGVWYLRAATRVRAKGRHWGPGRTSAFLAGLLTIELALGSFVATWSMGSFAYHIWQHLLLMVVAPPLLALGAPSTLLLQTAPKPVRSAWLRVLHSTPFAVLTHPVVVWFLYYGAMFAFFLSPALAFAMTHMDVMDLWNIGFFVGAACFWWPMVGLDPIPRWRMGYGMRFINLLIGVPFESFLGIALLTLTSPVAPMYTLDSTHLGAGILWAATELFTVAALVPIFVQWSRADTRQARRDDARLDAAALAGTAPVAAAEGPDPARMRGLAATFAAIRREA